MILNLLILPHLVALSQWIHTQITGESAAAGYDGNGIIICFGVEEFYAYDRTCPHDYVTNSLSIKVNIDPSNSMIGICPKCGTKYGLTVGGTPVEGVGQLPSEKLQNQFCWKFCDCL